FGTAFYAAPHMPVPETNLTTLASLSEWLAQDPNFLSIPSKNSPFRPIRPLSDPAKQGFKLAGYFLLPVVVLAGGLWRWQNRRKQRERVRSLFQRNPAT
ncbi:MAG TPA: hypothetical protein P5079_02050, partial [Elusimicrobiota bacterium]|nr:hypothetical protein [Elusimicrobiota bacterium]